MYLCYWALLAPQEMNPPTIHSEPFYASFSEMILITEDFNLVQNAHKSMRIQITAGGKQQARPRSYVLAQAE